MWFTRTFTRNFLRTEPPGLVYSCEMTIRAHRERPQDQHWHYGNVEHTFFFIILLTALFFFNWHPSGRSTKTLDKIEFCQKTALLNLVGHHLLGLRGANIRIVQDVCTYLQCTWTEPLELCSSKTVNGMLFWQKLVSPNQAKMLHIRTKCARNCKSQEEKKKDFKNGGKIDFQRVHKTVSTDEFDIREKRR